MSTPSNPQTIDLRTALRAFIHPRVVTLLFLGFSAGVPILLIFSSLGLWLREAGVERSAVTFFSWAALGYSFKFVWAPLVDQLPLPILTRLLGRRRSWMLVSQFAVIASILWMASTDPSAGQSYLTVMAIAAVALGFSSATQDIVIDAYRIESAGEELQALMSSTYIAGYRIGMLVAGAGALFLAGYFGSEKGSYSYEAWQMTYSIVACVMLVGVITTLMISEPDAVKNNEIDYSHIDYLRFLLLFFLAVLGFILTFYFSSEIANSAKYFFTEQFSNKHLSSFFIETVRLLCAAVIAWIVVLACVRSGVVRYDMVQKSYVNPVIDFFNRYGSGFAFLLLSVVGLYRISDIVLGVISNLFYQDLGYSKVEIASIVKTFGLLMTIAGGFLGGLLSVKLGVTRILFIGALLSAITNLLFAWLANIGYNIPMLYFVISADNLSAGLAGAAFVAFLSSLTNISFTAVQYAIFTSVMTLFPKIIGGYSGSMVENIGYQNFFYFTAILGIPVLFLVAIADSRLRSGKN